MPLAACAPPRQSTEARLARMDQALGASQASPSKYLRYGITSDAGLWTREIVVTASAYAERRTRSDGVRYAFGRDAIGGWLRIGGGEVIEASASMWDQEARTGAGLFGLRFTQPGEDDEATTMGKDRRAWELAYRPAGGRTLTFAVDHWTSEPKAYDVVDDFGRLVSCADLSFTRGATGPVLAAFRCSTNDRFGFAGKALHEDARLEADQAIDMAAAPAWAQPGPARVSPPLLAKPVEVPITNERRPEVPARFGDRDPVNLIVDTGAFFTILSRRAAQKLGVVPTGETRLHVDPPWLARSHLWVGVVEKLTLAGA
ncbi:MAG: retropepsin-like aspartic protease [Minicystis sp.]